MTLQATCFCYIITDKIEQSIALCLSSDKKLGLNALPLIAVTKIHLATGHSEQFFTISKREVTFTRPVLIKVEQSRSKKTDLGQHLKK